MKAKLFAMFAGAVVMFSAPLVSAKGCLKGAAVGGVAGHVAGHHGVLGAAGGCLIGRHRANKQEKENAKAQAQAPASQPKSTQSQSQPATGTRPAQ